MYHTVFCSPIGALFLQADESAIVSLTFVDTFQPPLKELNPILLHAVSELEAYFKGSLKAFSIPVCPSGTEFQKKVWHNLLAISYGETYSYQQIAETIGNPKACRAVGGANNKNPISIFIPCHRVIGADGSLTGYGGGMERKLFLLDLEKKYK